MESLNVLLIGGGGREHALAWSLSKSPLLGNLYIAPGNPGTASLGENVSLDINDFEEVAEFCDANDIQLVVVGPEQPLVDGITDYLEDEGIKVFGPSKNAAQLEGSKSFAKAIMEEYDIPTASYTTFNRHEWSLAEEYINQNDIYPLVIKADGLAAGKGVFVCDNRDEAMEALTMMNDDVNLSSASYRIVIEEFLTGEEVSVFAICDGETARIIMHAQDHKRIGEGDKGLNTGGMGAYAPAPLLGQDDLNHIDETIIKPMMAAMIEEGLPYKGILYCGLMMTDQGPKVVEFNCRFGDPECQVMVPAIKSDLLELLMTCVNGKLSYVNLDIDTGFYTGVVMASKGYPLVYEKGKKIDGIDKLSHDILVFHSGTYRSDTGDLLTNGGRVLCIVGRGDTLGESISKTYAAVEKISFENAYYRRDIGAKGLRRIEQA
ncbi:MAG: phosphoribosylamine--glycine ligase [Rhodothermaceae bacterium]|nr:phosphoribosylamine--glycine ligase [Rhodothermaceae bacterium]